MSYKIGIDGGGTKTEAILVDPAGAVIARHLAAGCNPSQIGPEKARALLQEALDAVRTHSPAAITHTLLCMAGNRAFWAETAAALDSQRFGTVTALDDSRPVLELATQGAPGLVLHAGTGSFVAARALDGSIHYAGGLGWKFGDPASGFDLGRRAIAAALLELQRKGSQPGATFSTLAAALREHTGIDDYTTNSRFFYNDPNANAKISGFAPRVIELALQDCGAAQQVVADSITDFARQADEVIQRLFPRAKERLPCGISGRILNSEPAGFVLKSLADKLNWPLELKFIDASPIEGVRLLLQAR